MSTASGLLMLEHTRMLFLRAPSFKYGICIPTPYSIIVMALMSPRPLNPKATSDSGCMLRYRSLRYYEVRA